MLKAAPCQPVTADSLNRLRQKLSALKSAKVAPSVHVAAEDGRENSHTATTHGDGAAFKMTVCVDMCDGHHHQPPCLQYPVESEEQGIHVRVDLGVNASTSQLRAHR